MRNDDEIKELITRRRRQILLHSCIYYRFNNSIIDDKKFDAWAYELARLQKSYPDLSAQCVYAEEFEGFDGTTGFNLPLDNPKLVAKAEHHIWLHQHYQVEAKKAGLTMAQYMNQIGKEIQESQ